MILEAMGYGLSPLFLPLLVVTCCSSIIKIVAMLYDCRNSLGQLRFFDYLCRIV